jgi:hypothetical protein
MLRKAYCPAIGRETRANYPDASENERVGTALRAFAHPTLAVPSPGSAAGPKKRRGRALGPSLLYLKCAARRKSYWQTCTLLADLHARADPSIAVPNRLTVRPIALRRSDQSRYEQRQDAKRAATATVVAIMVMVVMMMMVVLRDLTIARRVLADPFVIGFQRSERVRDRFEKVAVAGYGFRAG